MSATPTAWCRTLGNYPPAATRTDARHAGTCRIVSRDPPLAVNPPRVPTPNVEWLERRQAAARKMYTNSTPFDATSDAPEPTPETIDRRDELALQNA